MIYVIVLLILAAAGSGIYFLFIKKVPMELQIQRMYEYENYIGIIDYYRKHQEKIKNSLKAAYFYGASLYKIDDISNAILCLAPIEKKPEFENFPFKSQYYEILADCFFNSGSFLNAFYYFYLLLQNEPNNFHALFRIGHIYAANGQFNKAKVFLNDAKQLKPKNKDIFLILGQMELLENRYSEAISYLNVVKEMDTKNINVLFYIGYAKLALKNLSEAVDYLKQVITKTKDPKLLTISYYLLGNIFQKQNNTKMAIEYYQKFLENRKFAKKEFIEDVLYNLMLAYFYLREYQKAFQILDILFSMDRNYKDVSDIAFERDRIVSKTEFIKQLEDWSSINQIIFPDYVIEDELLFAKNVDLKPIEKKLGIVVKTNEKMTYDEFINSKYQDWVITNEQFLKILGFYDIASYNIDSDPDIYSGKGCMYTAKRKNGSTVTSFLIKFSRNKNISKEYIYKLKQIKEEAGMERVIFIHAYNIPSEILMLASENSDIDFISRNGYQQIFSSYILSTKSKV